MKKIIVLLLGMFLMASVGSVNAGMREEVTTGNKCFCAERWQDDYRMRKYCIEKQGKSFDDMMQLGIPFSEDSEERRIILKAIIKWTENINSRSKLSFKEARMTGCIDWRMALYEAKKQLEAYKSIQ